MRLFNKLGKKQKFSHSKLKVSPQSRVHCNYFIIALWICIFAIIFLSTFLFSIVSLDLIVKLNNNSFLVPHSLTEHNLNALAHNCWIIWIFLKKFIFYFIWNETIFFFFFKDNNLFGSNFLGNKIEKLTNLLYFCFLDFIWI